MTQRVSIAEAKDHLPRLLRAAENGAAIEIARRGRPVAILVSLDEYRRRTEQKKTFAQAWREFRKKYPNAFRENDARWVDRWADSLRDPSPGRKVSL